MAFVPAVDTARVCVNQTLHGQLICNILHFTKAGGWSAADLTALANAVIAAWNTRVGPVQSTDVQYTNVQARDMSAQDAEIIEVPFPALSGGDVVGAALPGNCATCVSFRTGFGGRSRRGRIYLSGLVESLITGNQLSEGHRNTIQQNMNAFIADMLAAGFQLAVASYFSGVAPGGGSLPRATALVTPILTALVDGWVDSQRRRLQGRGN